MVKLFEAKWLSNVNSFGAICHGGEALKPKKPFKNLQPNFDYLRPSRFLNLLF
jgi:hypothetical protein